MNCTTHQIKIIHSILPVEVKNDPDLKKEFISSFSEAGHSSTKDLTEYEADDLIYFLRTGKNIKYSQFARFDASNKQHNYILSLCHQLGWTTYSKFLRRNIVDLEHLGSWMRKYSYLHKALMDYTSSELPKLVSQFETLLKKGK